MAARSDCVSTPREQLIARLRSRLIGSLPRPVADTRTFVTHTPKTKRPRCAPMSGTLARAALPQDAARGWQPRMAPVQESAAVRPNSPTPELLSGRQAIERYWYLGAGGMARMSRASLAPKCHVGIESGKHVDRCVDRTPLLTFMLAVINVGGCVSGPRPEGLRFHIGMIGRGDRI